MKRLDMTQAVLSRYFRYNEVDGDLYWNQDRPRDGMRAQAYGAWKSACAGKRVGTTASDGKRVLLMGGIMYQVARIVAVLTKGGIGENESVTYADGNPLNLRASNLVVVHRGTGIGAKPRKDPARKVSYDHIERSDLEHQISYDPATGGMRWKKDAPQGLRDGIAHKTWLKTVAGNEIKTIDKDGYVIFVYCGKRYPAHRAAIAIFYGRIDKNIDVDHINGIRSDNRIVNLRVVDRSTNNKNSRMPLNNTSGHTGVYWRKDIQKWAAQGGHNGRTRSIGTFDDFDKAVAARMAWQEKVGGFTDRHGKQTN